MMSIPKNSSNKGRQASALINGLQLARALNRTLILPKFLCPGKYCNFFDVFGYCISFLDDNAVISYRENMFLENPLVPQKVKNSITEEVLDIEGKPEFQNETRLNRILKELSEYEVYSVIRASVPYNANVVLNENITESLKDLYQSFCGPNERLPKGPMWGNN